MKAKEKAKIVNGIIFGLWFFQFILVFSSVIQTKELFFLILFSTLNFTLFYFIIASISLIEFIGEIDETNYSKIIITKKTILTKNPKAKK